MRQRDARAEVGGGYTEARPVRVARWLELARLVERDPEEVERVRVRPVRRRTSRSSASASRNRSSWRSSLSLLDGIPVRAVARVEGGGRFSGEGVHGGSFEQEYTIVGRRRLECLPDVAESVGVLAWAWPVALTLAVAALF